MLPLVGLVFLVLAFLFIAPGPAKCGVETVMIKRLLEPFGFHYLGVLFGPVRKGTDLVLTLGVNPYLDVHLIGFGY